MGCILTTDRAKHMDDCSAVTQVHRAQDLGAAGVIFANDPCFSIVRGCCMDATIPALSIYKEDSEAIVQGCSIHKLYYSNSQGTCGV